MTAPTISEIYMLPDPVFTSEFALQSVVRQGFDQFEPEVFRMIRTTLVKAEWVDDPGLSKVGGPNENRLVLTFHDVQGDQNYLNAHYFLREDLARMQIDLFDKRDGVMRCVNFDELRFLNSTQKFDSADESKCAYRVLSYGYKHRRETLPE